MNQVLTNSDIPGLSRGSKRSHVVRLSQHSRKSAAVIVKTEAASREKSVGSEKIETTSPLPAPASKSKGSDPARPLSEMEKPLSEKPISDKPEAPEQEPDRHLQAEEEDKQRMERIQNEIIPPH